MLSKKYRVVDGNIKYYETRITTDYYGEIQEIEFKNERSQWMKIKDLEDIYIDYYCGYSDESPAKHELFENDVISFDVDIAGKLYELQGFIVADAMGSFSVLAGDNYYSMSDIKNIIRKSS